MAFPFLRTFTFSVALAIGGNSVLADGLSGAYLAGRQASYSGDFTAAAQYYTRALARDPSNPILLENAILAQLSLGKINRALPIARKVDADGLESQLANMVLTASLVADGDYEMLVDRLESDKGIGPLVDGLVLAWGHVGRGAMSDAISAFDDVAKEPGLLSFAHYHKALALASVGDFEGAQAIYSDANNSVQVTRRGVTAMAQVLSQLERNDEAIALLDGVFGIASNPASNPAAQALRRRLEAGEVLEFTSVQSARDGIAEVFFSIASALEGDANPDYTLLYARIAEFLKVDHIDALLLSASLLERLERYELATQTYARVPADHPSFHEAELGRADVLRKADKMDAAIEVLQQLTRTHSEIAIVYSTLGDFLRQQKDFEGAVHAYDTALLLTGEEGRGRWFVYYARGISNERLENWVQAEADFRAALELNPEQPQVLNYLGYSLVEKQEKLDEALGMIERAVAAQPESGYIVDSLGWVLYRLGRYEEAVAHMERAAELMPIDAVVNDHLGDVYWAVGRHLEAAFQWRRALSFVDEETTEEAEPDRIRRKLDIGLDKVLKEEGAEPLSVSNEG